MSRCRSCQSPIVWVRMLDTGKLMPVNHPPDPRGTVAVHRDPDGELTGHTLRGDATAGEGEVLGMAHWATCPQAGRFRPRGAT